MKRLDHLVYVTPDLEGTIEELAKRFGVRAELGGRHPGRSTRNALLSLGPDRYFEILGPDSGQPSQPRPRWLGLDGLTAARLTTWVARSDDLERDLEHARLAGEELGAVADGSRKREDGVELRWRMAGVDAPRMGGVIPFLIDWNGSPHPGTSSPGGCRLIELHAEHPDAARAKVVVESLGLELPVLEGPAPRLIARLATPRGEITLT